MIASVEERDGYRIVKRGDVKKTVSAIDCPLCLCVVIDEMDTVSIVRSGCCLDCEHEVADLNREKWLAGWRPPKREIDRIRKRRLASAHSRKHN